MEKHLRRARPVLTSSDPEVNYASLIEHWNFLLSLLLVNGKPVLNMARLSN